MLVVWSDRCSLTVTAFDSHTFEKFRRVPIMWIGVSVDLLVSADEVVDMSYDNVYLTTPPPAVVNRSAALLPKPDM